MSENQCSQVTVNCNITYIHPPIRALLLLQASHTQLSVVDLDRVSVGSEHCVAAQSRLSASTNALQVLGRRQALVLDEVGEEQVDVGVEALDLLAVGGQEREDGHVAVGALVDVPLLAGDGGGGEDLGVALRIPAAVVGVSPVLRGKKKWCPCFRHRHGDDLPSNRPSIDVGQPNHHLILLGSTGGIASEQIVRNIRNEVAARVRPAPSRRNRLDLRNRYRVRLDDDVGEALDAVLAARPRPGRVPLDDRATLAVESGALAAGSGGALAPEVVVEGIIAGHDVVPVAAHVGAASEGRRSGRCSGQEGHGAGEGGEGELHLDRLVTVVVVTM